MDRGDIEQLVRQTVADVLGISVDELPKEKPGEVSPERHDWESVQNLNIILALETALGVQFAPEQMEAMGNIPAIIDVIERQTP